MMEMFGRLMFSQMAAELLVEEQGRDSPQTLVSIFDVKIAAICDIIRRPDGLVSKRIPDRVNQNVILEVKNLKLAAFAFKAMESLSKSYDIYCIHKSALHYQQQWKLEQRKTDDPEVPKVDKNNWVKKWKLLCYMSSL